MEDHDKTGSEVHGLIEVKKHTGDDAVDSMKKGNQGESGHAGKSPGVESQS